MLSYRFHARVINILQLCLSKYGVVLILYKYIFQQDRILPVQLFCTSIRTETKQNTCVSLSYIPMYLYFQTASESEKVACM